MAEDDSSIFDYLTELGRAKKAYLNATPEQKETAKGEYIKLLKEARDKEKEGSDKRANLQATIDGLERPSGTADIGGRRRRRRGGKHTKRHKKGGKSRRARTGRKSSRL